MCGIAGYIEVRNRRDDATILDRMLNRVAHRGPDGQGTYRGAHGDWICHLGHRRLSIIDTSGGHQPMSNAARTLHLSFNGEISNFVELRQSLKERGHGFHTRSDTEVLVHHFEAFGTSGLKQLNGMFAFAAWNETTGELCLARDRTGIKPLYLSSLVGGGLVFASSLTAVLEHPEIRRELDSEAAAYYLMLDYFPAPFSAIRGVYKLEPGHCVVWKSGVLGRAFPFWKPPSEEKYPTEDFSLVKELRSRLENAVEKQMVSDVPVGVFLSGGIDSSLVAAIAQRQSSHPLRTFSIGFDDPAYDESAFARRVAQHIGSTHFEQKLSEELICEITEEALEALDEPLADPSYLPTFLLSRFASQHVKVALGGDGGDEVWAGYATYRAAAWGKYFGKLPAPIRSLARTAAGMLPVSDRHQSLEWKLKRFVDRWDPDPRLCHLRWVSGTDAAEVSAAASSPFSPGETLFRFSPSSDTLNPLLAHDLQTFLPGSVLCKLDRASMAHGLEVRPPLLDNEIVDWAFTLPSRYKLRGNTSKYLLKRVAQELLPREILYRRKKGFAIPLARWLRGPFAHRIENSLTQSPVWQLFSRRQVESWFADHRAKRKDHSRALWAIAVLDHWMKRNGIAIAT